MHVAQHDGMRVGKSLLSWCAKDAAARHIKPGLPLAYGRPSEFKSRSVDEAVPACSVHASRQTIRSQCTDH